MTESKPFHTISHSVFIYGDRELSQGNTVSTKETLTALYNPKDISRWRGNDFIKNS
jgi:hypothetical protein